LLAQKRSGAILAGAAEKIKANAARQELGLL
jgi:hypothetical protein